MATSVAVKERSSWKTVTIPHALFNEHEFGSLVEIQELTDYELVPFKADLVNKGPSRLRLSKKQKRKRENVERTSLVDVDHATPQLIEEQRKRRKLESHSGNVICQDKSNVTSTTTKNIDDGLEQFAVQKKLKKKNTNSFSKRRKSNNEIDMIIESTDDVTGMKDTTSELYDELEDQNVGEICAPAISDEIEKVCKKRKRKKRKGGTLRVHSKIEDDSFLKSEGTNHTQNIGAEDLTSKKNVPRDSQIKGTHKETSVKLKRQQISTSEDEESVAQKKNKSELDMCQWKNLFVPDVLQRALQDMSFDTPTPIQQMALPSAIRDRRDILAAAETGSGKTLAFGIPVFTRILNALENFEKKDQDEIMEFHESELETNSIKTNVGHRLPLALILEPTRELAVQVKNHLTALAKYTDIKIVTIVGGMSIEKQRRILGKKPHVVIATPGRLWQHMEEGNEHLGQVDKVLCLVVDEADRMIERGHYEELTKLMEMMNKSPQCLKKRQTFIMSATLTMDVGAPKRVANKMKKKMISEDKLKTLTDRICIGSKPKVIDLTPKDKVAHTLTELRMNCKAEEKDFYLYYFLCHHSGRTLVFANSKDCVRRLVSLLTLLQCSPLPLHADMQQRQRLKNFEKFAANNKGLLVASDVAARGLDIPNVDHVIHYQVPRTMENYIHRSGRTARASNLGLSVMFVGPEDARDYRKIVHGVRNGEELPLLPIEADLLPAVKQRVVLARNIDVKEYRIKKKKLKNNFFTKAAQEMDMLIDDTNLLEDMGDLVEQAEEKQQLKHMKTHLASLLRGSLMPTHMTKYPTKSGQLVSSKIINLHNLR